MMARTSRRQFEDRAVHGFVLVEVMVAALLAAFLVGPLATSMQSAVAMARNLRSEAAGLSDVDAQGKEAAAWVWGPMVEAVLWDLGPELTVRVRSQGRGSVLVGAWADGWNVGEWEAQGDNQLKLTASVWSGLTGKELLVRAREPQGHWGPPWRTIVPDAWGVVSEDGAAELVDGSAGGVALGEERAVVHVPAFSVPELKASWTTTPACETAAGLAFVLATSGPGRCEVELGARRQSWHGVLGRGLDVYY